MGWWTLLTRRRRLPCPGRTLQPSFTDQFGVHQHQVNNNNHVRVVSVRVVSRARIRRVFAGASLAALAIRTGLIIKHRPYADICVVAL